MRDIFLSPEKGGMVANAKKYFVSKPRRTMDCFEDLPRFEAYLKQAIRVCTARRFFL
jgi:hypothetical protein